VQQTILVLLGFVLEFPSETTFKLSTYRYCAIFH